jgi:hypothetical protein
LNIIARHVGYGRSLVIAALPSLGGAAVALGQPDVT